MAVAPHEIKLQTKTKKVIFFGKRDNTTPAAFVHFSNRND